MKRRKKKEKRRKKGKCSCLLIPLCLHAYTLKKREKRGKRRKKKAEKENRRKKGKCSCLLIPLSLHAYTLKKGEKRRKKKEKEGKRRKKKEKRKVFLPSNSLLPSRLHPELTAINMNCFGAFSPPFQAFWSLYGTSRPSRRHLIVAPLVANLYHERMPPCHTPTHQTTRVWLLLPLCVHRTPAPLSPYIEIPADFFTLLAVVNCFAPFSPPRASTPSRSAPSLPPLSLSPLSPPLRVAPPASHRAQLRPLRFASSSPPWALFFFFSVVWASRRVSR